MRLTRGLKHGLRYCWDGDPADWWEVEHYWYVLKLMRVE